MTDREHDERASREELGYEPPALEDLDASEGPSVTAAGTHTTGTTTVAKPTR